MKKLLHAGLMAVVGTSTLGAQTGSTITTTDVPVRSVMLFSSGVGFFEHGGLVRGNSATELRFKTAQINDILKSLVLQDEDGGRVTAITYPSQDPIVKTLRSFQVDITANPSLASLLNQLRGARVTVQVRAERLKSSVLGVETRSEQAANGTVETPVLNLLTGSTIRAIELPSITSLSLDDPGLQDELTKALGALSQARDQDKKPVTISFTGAGERRVRVGYVVETPIWKTSYRLLLDEHASRLQGWAIVENQTESDWKNVSLSLVSGRPMSFMMDLYQPLYLARPTVTQPLFAGLRPRLYDAGLDGAADTATMQASGGGGRGGAANQDFSGRGVAGGRAAGVGSGPIPLGAFTTTGRSLAQEQMAAQALMLKAPPPEPDYARAIESNVTGNRMGELFQYQIGNVTLARQKSAMLPIIADSVSVERLSIYNQDVLRSNPLNGVRIRNTTGKHLLEGPVTVLDGNNYAGDAQINNVPPGQERLLSYGIDLEMTVEPPRDSSALNVITGRIVKGVLSIERKTALSRTYRAENKSDREKTLLIEHPHQTRNGFKLVGTQQPVETTDRYYRFQGRAAPRTVTILVVNEEAAQVQSIAMLAVNVDQLLFYSRSGEIPAAVRDALAQVIRYKQAITETARLIQERARQTADITTEQGRIRENMKTVAQNSPYYKRLLEKLNEQESALEKLASERVELQAREAAETRQLEAYLSTLSVG